MSGARGALRKLREHFERNGYVRSPRDPDDSNSHRGYELRFSALDEAERDRIVRLLRRAGFEPGKPFTKGPAWRIPMYGRQQVAELLLRMGVD